MYSEIDFRGKYIFEERRRAEKGRLVAASFCAWQGLVLHVEKPPTWEKYMEQLGLTGEAKAIKGDLKREADQALANVDKIIAKARQQDGRR